MSLHWISISALVAVFVFSTVWQVNMGVAAFVAAFLVGSFAAGMDAKEIIHGFPAGLFLTLVGITYLFAMAQANGAIDWLITTSVRAVRGRVSTIPWIMFAITALLTSLGAVSPAAVAIVAPIALGFAAKYRVHPLLMGLFVIHGAQAGGFSPVSIYGGITNNIVKKAGLPPNETFPFLASLGANMAAATFLFLVMHRNSAPDASETEADESQAPSTMAFEPDRPTPTFRFIQAAMLLGLMTLAVLVLVCKVDIGFAALTIAAVLSILSPTSHKDALSQVCWSEIMLITGVGTYVAVMEKMGTINFVGDTVGGMTSPGLASLLLCAVAAVVSAFASSTAVLGSLIPLAVPLLRANSSIDPGGFIGAMAVCSTIVDVSPFSTNGAIVLASARIADRDRLLRQLMIYGALVTATAPLLTWLLFVML